MSLNSTSTNVGIKDGANTAEVNEKRQLLVSEPELQRLNYLLTEQLRQTTKLVLILSAMSGITVADSDIDIPNF